MTTFALIHGGCSDSTHWKFVTGELGARGHRTLTTDLPMTDPAATQADYARVAARDFAAAAEPVVLVAHSMAGAVGLQLAEQLPTKGLVLVAAAIFYSPEQAPDAPPVQPAGAAESPIDGGLLTMSEAAVDEMFFDCSDEVFIWAAEHITPQGVLGMSAPFGPAKPSVPGVYIQADSDRTISGDYSRWLSHALFDKPPVTIPGGHAPYLSRPAELAALLDKVAQDF